MFQTSRVLVITATIVSLAATGCAKDPAKGVAKAKVEEPKKEAKKDEAKKEAPKAAEGEAGKGETGKGETGKVAAAAAAAAPAAPAAGKALTGSIIFIGSKATGSHENIFKEWTGTMALKDGKAEGGSLSLVVKTASAVADHNARTPWSGKLDSHFKSCDFFCVEKFPEATFTSEAIKAGAEGGSATHTVAGKLTIRGKTKDVSFPATIAVADGKVTGKAEFSINRKDFDIVYKGKADDLIRDDVVLKIDVSGAAG